jgi:anti-anti-sigma factor
MPPDEDRAEDDGYSVDHDPVDGAHLVTAEGELDLAAAPRLATVLSMAVEGPERSVVLDLLPVTFIDSTALGAIMQASGNCETAGKRMLVVVAEGPVRRLLEITNLTGRFGLYPDLESALAAAAAGELTCPGTFRTRGR